MPVLSENTMTTRKRHSTSKLEGAPLLKKRARGMANLSLSEDGQTMGGRGVRRKASADAEKSIRYHLLWNQSPHWCPTVKFFEKIGLEVEERGDLTSRPKSLTQSSSNPELLGGQERNHTNGDSSTAMPLECISVEQRRESVSSPESPLSLLSSLDSDAETDECFSPKPGVSHHRLKAPVISIVDCKRKKKVQKPVPFSRVDATTGYVKRMASLNARACVTALMEPEYSRCSRVVPATTMLLRDRKSPPKAVSPDRSQLSVEREEASHSSNESFEKVHDSSLVNNGAGSLGQSHSAVSRNVHNGLDTGKRGEVMNEQHQVDEEREKERKEMEVRKEVAQVLIEMKEKQVVVDRSRRQVGVKGRNMVGGRSQVQQKAKGVWDEEETDESGIDDDFEDDDSEKEEEDVQKPSGPNSARYNSMGLLYSGDTVYPSVRVFLTSERELPNRIFPQVIPTCGTHLEKAIKDAIQVHKRKGGKLRPVKGDNGWTCLGAPIKTIHYKKGKNLVTRKYYIGIKRRMEELHVRDTITVKSGPRKEDKPYIAKITAIWQETGGIMVTLLWYYRPEDAEGVSLSEFSNCEVLASQHLDDNSVACIEGQCNVLGLRQFCRYRAAMEKNRLLSARKRSILTRGAASSRGKHHRSENDEGPDQEVFLCYRSYNHITGWAPK